MKRPFAYFATVIFYYQTHRGLVFHDRHEPLPLRALLEAARVVALKVGGAEEGPPAVGAGEALPVAAALERTIIRAGNETKVTRPDEIETAGHETRHVTVSSIWSRDTKVTRRDDIRDQVNK